MKMFKPFAFALLVLAATAPAFAQKQIVVASNSGSGTYDKMLKEIITVCPSDSVEITPLKGASGGSVGNLSALFENQAQAAFLHSDVYLYSAQADPSYARLQTLVALYPEPIHVLMLKQSPFTKVVKPAGYFSKEVRETITFNSLADVDGLQVGASGGGFVTIRVLKGADAKFTPQEFASGGDVIKALEAGTIAAAVFVGAAPLPNLAADKLDRTKFKIVPIGESIASRLTTVYRPARVNYPGLTNGPVQTLAPLALLMTRKYSTPDKIAAQRYLRDCVTQKLPDLQDGHSPNWQDVTANDHGIATIPWLDLPASTATVKK